jgi:hypothetical protein
VALACAHSAALSTQAKREVSRLWDDTSKSPYKILFNAKTNHLRAWRMVQILRAIDRELESARSGLDNRTKGRRLEIGELRCPPSWMANQLSEHDAAIRLHDIGPVCASRALSSSQTARSGSKVLTIASIEANGGHVDAAAPGPGVGPT